MYNNNNNNWTIVNHVNATCNVSFFNQVVPQTTVQSVHQFFMVNGSVMLFNSVILHSTYSTGLVFFSRFRGRGIFHAWRMAGTWAAGQRNQSDLPNGGGEGEGEERKRTRNSINYAKRDSWHRRSIPVAKRTPLTRYNVPRWWSARYLSTVSSYTIYRSTDRPLSLVRIRRVTWICGTLQCVLSISRNLREFVRGLLWFVPFLFSFFFDLRGLGWTFVLLNLNQTNTCSIFFWIYTRLG